MVQIFCSYAHKIPFLKILLTYAKKGELVLLYFVIFLWILI